MSHTRSIKDRAVAMRRARKSYREITTALGVPKGTLSGWFNGQGWSVKIRKELDAATRPIHRARIIAMSRARSARFLEVRAHARHEARTQFPKLVSDPLFTTGIALYWGEGDKQVTGSKVRMSNVDPGLLQTFIRFLITYGAVERQRLRIGVLVYPDLNVRTCVRYWSGVLDIPPAQFHKTQVIPGRSKRRRLPHGVCIVGIGDYVLAEKIGEWTRCLWGYLCGSANSVTV